MIVKLILIYLVCACALSNSENITYSEPGEYTLSAWEYNYSEYILVEMWGAGGGGSSFNIGNGGGAGAFISAIIRSNNDTFIFTIGQGGVGGSNYSFTSCYSKQPSYSSIIGTAGGDTQFTNGDCVNLVAGGGDNGASTSNHGIVKSLGTNTNKYYYKDGGDGYSGSCYNYYCSTNPPFCGCQCGGYDNFGNCRNYISVSNIIGGTGGSSYNGGIGGQGSKIYGCSEITYYDSVTEGNNPGGGGGGYLTSNFQDLTCDCYLSDNNYNYYGYGAASGGNGSVIVYYNLNLIANDVPCSITPTRSLSSSITPTRSLSSSTTPTISKSHSLSSSITPTISVSSSITTSLSTTPSVSHSILPSISHSGVNINDIVLFILVLCVAFFLFLCPFTMCYIKRNRDLNMQKISGDPNTSLLTSQEP